MKTGLVLEGGAKWQRKNCKNLSYSWKTDENKALQLLNNKKTKPQKEQHKIYLFGKLRR